MNLDTGGPPVTISSWPTFYGTRRNRGIFLSFEIWQLKIFYYLYLIVYVVENTASSQPFFLFPSALEANPLIANAPPGSLILVPAAPGNQMVHVSRLAMPSELKRNWSLSNQCFTIVIGTHKKFNCPYLEFKHDYTRWKCARTCYTVYFFFLNWNLYFFWFDPNGYCVWQSWNFCFYWFEITIPYSPSIHNAYWELPFF